MTARIIPFDYEGQAVRFNGDGWIHATEIAERFGKEPAQWLRLDSTKEYIERLTGHMEKSNVGKSHITLVKTRRGNTAIIPAIPDRNLKQGVANTQPRMYRPPVAANSATGFDGPNTYRRTSAPISIAGAFFVPAHPVYGGCAWETFGSAGFLYARPVNLRTAATLIRLTANSGSSPHTGATPMPTLNPSVNRIRAFAHRRMALAALHADSSLATRIKRYSHHMAKARTLEAQGGAA